MFEVDNLIKMALEEDLGSGDITTSSLISGKLEGKAQVFAKEDLVLAGMEIFSRVFQFLDPEAKLDRFYPEGAKVAKSEAIGEIRGDLAALLKGERTALNFLQRLCGIASLTRKYVEKIKGYPVKLIDTRKTTPGWRTLEKYAVRVGGGGNHRIGLFDGVIIKDNHIKACGGIILAVNKARTSVPHTLKIEVEVTNLREVEEALLAEVDIIMLDNMEMEMMREAVKIVNKGAIIEASGGITLDHLEEIAKIGVDLISVGAITHSAPASSVSMKIVTVHDYLSG